MTGKPRFSRMTSAHLGLLHEWLQREHVRKTYLAADYPEWTVPLADTTGVAGVDLFIADEELIGKGIGSEALRAFTRDIVFARAGTLACIADPDARNAASIRAFAKAGFRVIEEFFDPNNGETHALMRLERPLG